MKKCKPKQAAHKKQEGANPFPLFHLPFPPLLSSTGSLSKIFHIYIFVAK
jgi:hypothetical protein